MSSIRTINIDTYRYDLPDERIAKYPLAQRDASKLLLYKKGNIEEKIFTDIVDELPAGCLLVFNNTRVIHARLHFILPNGRRLEILCLDPLFPLDYQQNLSSTEAVSWKCMVGGNRRWKSGEIIMDISVDNQMVTLTAKRVERLEGTFEIEFSWNNQQFSFGELLTKGGIIPLPPYLNRASEESDSDRYQTIYAQPEGSVAAPTAGLHFTPAVMHEMKERGIQQNFVTLHVGAGTFKPVKTDRLGEHEMHRERIFIDLTFVEQLAQTLANKQAVIPVGTTSLRTLESLYWLGVRLVHNSSTSIENVVIGQWEPYEQTQALPSAKDAIYALLEAMKQQKCVHLEAATQLLIAPGYKSQLVSGLITNFHQPGSTLLLLVAALIGEEWKTVYDYAMQHNFRFLSYGDSSLLLV